MNVFLKQGLFLSDIDIFSRFSDFVTSTVHQLIANGVLAADQPVNTDKLVVELPRDESHGDLACNAAMVLAKQLSMKPRDLAAVLAKELEERDDVAVVDIAGPGFINIFLKSGIWPIELTKILNAASEYGRSKIGEGQAVNIEFVSANPTGPLHAAHARGAIFGDSLANLLEFCSFKVTREYYNIEKFKSSNLHAHIQLAKGQRSQLATEASLSL